MRPEDIEICLSVMTPCVPLLLSTTIFFQKFIKNKKLRNILQKTQQISKELIVWIVEAEKFSNYSGKEKKEYVMRKINQYANENKIHFNNEEFSKKIEELINLSKEVNPEYREKEATNEDKRNESLAIEKQIQKIIEGLEK